MTGSPPPGWYRDPTGRDGDARWHDGDSWTDQHLPAELVDSSVALTDLPTDQPDTSAAYYPGPSEQTVYSPTAGQWAPAPGAVRNPTAVYDVVSPGPVQQNAFSVQYGTDPAAPPAYRPRQSEPKPNRRPLWYALGGLATIGLVLLLLVATGVFNAVNPDDQAGPSGGVIDPGPTSGAQHDIRVVDQDSGISYKYLGDGWKDWSQGNQLEQQKTVGEYVITQEETPDGEFIAQVTSGLLSPEFGPASVSSYPTMLKAVLASVRGAYYPQPNTDDPLVSESIVIDGHKAYKYGVDLKWDVAGYDSTGERVVLILIDTGKERPAFVYCSFPNTHAELYPLIDEVIASIKVDA